jgi:hypothetical protein
MPEEMITAGNFMELFTRTLTRLTLRAGATMPISEFTAVEMYMLALASAFQFVLLDSTRPPQTWARLTPAGVRWLNDPVPLEQLKASKPVVIE